MNNEAASSIISTIAESVAIILNTSMPNWEKAYLRASYNKGNSEAKISYVSGNNVTIVNVLEHSDFFSSLLKNVEILSEAIEKEKFLSLLILDKEKMNYEVLFEYKKMSKWGITKLNGGSGVPEGL